jgi:hypothetical protein
MIAPRCYSLTYHVAMSVNQASNKLLFTDSSCLVRASAILRSIERLSHLLSATSTILPLSVEVFIHQSDIRALKGFCVDHWTTIHNSILPSWHCQDSILRTSRIRALDDR